MITVDLATGTVHDARDVPAATSWGAGGQYVTPDGRFVVWLQSGNPSSGRAASLVLHDVVTRVSSVLAFPSGNVHMVGHPRRPEVYLSDELGPIALSPAGVRRLNGPACAGPSNSASGISANGSRVVYSCSQATSEYFVVDTASGATVGTMSGSTPVLSRDGQSFYRREPGVLRRYPVAGGPATSEAALSDDVINVLSVDPRTGNVFAIGVCVGVFDEALTPVRGVPCFISSLPSIRTWTFDPQRPVAYATEGIWHEPRFFYHAYSARSTESDSLSVSYAFPGSWDQAPGVFVVPPYPAAPTLAPPVVAGSSVQLSWAATASNAVTTRFVLEVGSAPGLSNIFSGLDVGLQTSLAANGVPRGTYYVRVRAGNVAGPGAPSNEVVVQVP